MDFEVFKKQYQKIPVQENYNKVNPRPFVSVCVQTYQHINYIKDCLEGILMQKTSFPFEILIGDDESTDDTREICNEYARKFPDKIRLFLHHRENNIKINGMPTGRFNFIYNLYAARGEYIALCEGDDYWTDPLKLQKQVNFLKENGECSFCFHQAVRKNDFTNQVKKDNIYPVGITMPVLNTSDYLRLTTTATCSLMFRHISVQAHLNIIHSQGDFLLYCELLHYGKAGYLNEVMSVYRKHPKGVSFNNKSDSYLFNRIKELKIEQDFFKDPTVKKEISKIYEKHIIRYLKKYKGWKYFKKTLILKHKLLLNKISNHNFFLKLRNKFAI